MKYLKNFEMNYNQPKVGNYVICTDLETDDDTHFKYFINNNIGYLMRKNYIEVDYPCLVIYNNLPFRFRDYTIDDNNTIKMRRDEIIHYSNNKEELEEILKIKLSAKNFNI